MAFTDTDYAVCIAAIMAVETGGQWGTITAPDTLSLGAGQWTAGRAYDLLKQFPSGTSFGPTVDAWLAQGKSSWTYDSRKYSMLGATDRQMLSAALDSAAGRQIQTDQFVIDIRDIYLPVCQQAGLDYSAHPQAACLLINCLHQYGTGGKRPYRLVQMSAPDYSVDSMAYSLQYWGIWGEYPNRYSMAYDYIKRQVTNGIKVNGSGNDNTAAGEQVQQSTGVKQTEESTALSNKVKRATMLANGQLRVTMEDGSEAWGYQLQGNSWHFSPSQADAAQGSTPAKEDVPDPEPGNSKMEQMVALLKRDCQNKPYGYAQASGRLTPESSGISDCSGYVWYLYNKFYGIDIGPNGTSEIYSNNVGRVIARVSTAAQIQSAPIKAGDLIVYPGHIEMFTGEGTMSASMRGPADGTPGPNGPSPAEQIFAGHNCVIKRYV